jgi:hypothetical protein
MQCGHGEDKRQLIEDHIALVHSSHKSRLSNISISQKTVLRDLSSQNCPFCGDVPGSVKFVGHVCHHLEEISLSAVPQNDETDEELRKSSSGASLSSRIEAMAANSYQQDSPLKEGDESDNEEEQYPLSHDGIHIQERTRLPLANSGETAYLGLPMQLFRTSDDIVEHDGSDIPSSKDLEALLERLHQLVDVVEGRGAVCDRGMRMLAQARKDRLEEIESERTDQERTERL